MESVTGTNTGTSEEALFRLSSTAAKAFFVSIESIDENSESRAVGEVHEFSYKVGVLTK